MSTTPPNPAPDATLLLSRMHGGDADAANELLPLVYDQLRAIAGGMFRAQPAAHTLQPTSLVHEVYLKLVRSDAGGWESRAHFCAVASIAMRQILQDYARAKRAEKRGGGQGSRVPLEFVTMPGSASTTAATWELVDLDDALTQLAEINERQARIAELRYFADLSNEQIAEVLGVSVPTVTRSWRVARAWLGAKLSNDPDAPDRSL